MAQGDVLSGDNVKIWIEAVDTAAPNLATEFQAQVTNFNVTGGKTDYDSKAVFGGFIDLKKPQEQYEISMDVILRFGTDATKWDILGSDEAKKMIAIEATDDTNYYWNAFNNCRSVVFEKKFEADAQWEGTITFKLSPKTADGHINYQEGAAGSANDGTNGIQAW